MSIVLTWHGHSCFTVSCGGYSIVVDPYAPDSVPGYPILSLTADEVLTSHSHADHNGVGQVTITPGGAANPFRITTIDTFHDDQKGALRGSNRIHIFEADGIRAAHMGDIGCRLEPEQEKLLENLDAMMLPVGGFFTIEPAMAKKLTERVKPRVVIPMHYRSESGGFGYPKIGTLDAYTKLCPDVVQYAGNSIEITRDTPAQTAILSLCE